MTVDRIAYRAFYALIVGVAFMSGTIAILVAVMRH